MKKEKILLLLLPFWDPQIPPSGISCLKAFLQPYGYPVKTVDANIEMTLKKTYDKYFANLKEWVPSDKLGNFFKIGHDVLRNHMMCPVSGQTDIPIDDEAYIELVGQVVNSIFYFQPDREQILILNRIIQQFYVQLERFLLELLEQERPDVLGISVYSDTLPASLFAFKKAKEFNPDIKTLMGGGVFANDLAVGTSNLDYFVARTPYIDKILIGEGEYLFLKYLQGELPEDQKVFTLSDIDNYVADISTLPVQDLGDLQLDYYPYLTAYTSRSCPFQCSFCSETIQWGKYRKKSPVQVVDELKSLHQTHGSQLFLMSDSLLNPIIHELSDEMEREPLSLYWDGYLRADKRAADSDETMKWRRAGFYRARLGIESGSPHVLELMNKQITPELIKSALSGLAYAGIKTTTYWVVGFPGETEEDFQETLDLITEMADDIYEADCSPFWYYVQGQVASDGWADKRRLLFPAHARESLLVETWVLDLEPRRPEIYERMWRFVQHCKTLGLPNPYSIQDVNDADRRWLELHTNAVPPLVEFLSKEKTIDENKHLKKWKSADTTIDDEGDFGF